MGNLGYLCSIINLKSLKTHIINKNKQINKFAFVHLFTNYLFSKKKHTSFSNLFVVYVFFLFIIQLTKAKNASNTSLLYSFSILSVFFLFII